MVLVRNQSIAPELQGAVISIGNFDGVHLGHQALLAALKARAHALACPCGVIIFEPQPQEFFSKNPPARLTSLRQKYQLLKQQGIDFIMVLRFNNALAHVSAQDFVTRILAQQLQIRELMVGEDFRFGRDKLGDVALLEQLSVASNFRLNILADVDKDGQRISSTYIRSLLTTGKLLEARSLLGRYFSLSGRVISGDARGRTLNMPTANIAIPKQVPLQGIFVVRASFDGQYYPGVASLGVRPMFAVNQPILEVHLLDFNQDIYGKRLNVEFLHKLRDEAHFSSVELLQAQMQQDLLAAKNYWNDHHD